VFSAEDPRHIDHTLNISQSEKAPIVSTPSPVKQWPSSAWDIPPSNKKMPPLKDFRLTKELVQQRVKDNVVIVTFGNYAFMDFILTWVKKLTDLEVSNFLVGECREIISILFCFVLFLDLQWCVDGNAYPVLYH
jgi:arabinosyltransferase